MKYYVNRIRYTKNCVSHKCKNILFYFWISLYFQQEYTKMLKSRIEVGYEIISHSYLKKILQSYNECAQNVDSHINQKHFYS